MASQDPDLADVINAALQNHAAGFWTSLPGVVTSYDASTQTCSAQPQVQQGVYGEDGQRTPERLPVVNSVPVIFPGGGGYRVTFPVKAGDTCLLVFLSASTDKWQSLGEEVDPGDDRRNTLAHAVAFVGLNPPSSPLKDAPTDMMTVGKDDGGPVIEIDDSEIRVGGSGGDEPTFKANSFLGILVTLLGALEAVPVAWAVDSSVSTPFVATTTAMAALIGAIKTFVTATTTTLTLIAKVK